MSAAIIDEQTVILNSAYVSKEEVSEEPIYGYPRFLKNGELGFSVTDELSECPDFSNCSIIWVTPENFLLLFVPVRQFDKTGNRYTQPGKTC